MVVCILSRNLRQLGNIHLKTNRNKQYQTSAKQVMVFALDLVYWLTQEVSIPGTTAHVEVLCH